MLPHTAERLIAQINKDQQAAEREARMVHPGTKRERMAVL